MTRHPYLYRGEKLGMEDPYAVNVKKARVQKMPIVVKYYCY